MSFDLWFLVLGGLLVVIALIASVVRHLPLTTTILYLLVGLGLGAFGLGAIRLDPLRHAGFLERVTELAVIVSLFTAGLKIRVPVRDPLWRLPFRLASLSMVVTVGLITLAGTWGLGLPLGAAVLLGGILAPTDPVLASEVQLAAAGDRNRLRFGLTGEAGLNDGTAFPFVMLGLGLLGQHELGAWGWRWLAVDILWAVAAGLGIGFVLGTLVGRLVLFLRKEHKEAFGLDDFLALGLRARRLPRPRPHRPLLRRGAPRPLLWLPRRLRGRDRPAPHRAQGGTGRRRPYGPGRPRHVRRRQGGGDRHRPREGARLHGPGGARLQ